MKEYLLTTAEKYKNELIGNILPFWLDKGIDTVNGGIYTALDREGVLMDSDKSVWFQGRAAWTFAYCYNTVDRNARYLEACRSCIEFIEKHCFDTDGRMFYQVTATGVPVRKRRYVFSETFAAIAFAEYSIASGDQSYAHKALALFETILRNLRTPGVLEPKFLEGFKAKGHSICMILIDTAHCISRAIQSPILEAQIQASIAELRSDFLHEEFKAILETVALDGSFIDSMAGRTINPGHSLETGWFLLEESRLKGWDSSIKEFGLKVIDYSWEWGWDTKHGGILYFRDCRGVAQQEYWHDMKFWWPQNEAAIASLYALMATGDTRYLEMHKLVDQYQFSHLKDPDYPEWYGYLHYDGTVSQTAKGNMYKGPFHIARMLAKGYELCCTMADKL